MSSKQELQKIIDALKTKKYREGEAKGLITEIQKEQTQSLLPVLEEISRQGTQKMLDTFERAVNNIKIEIPEIKAPHISIPDVHIPPFPAIPTPVVNYTPPPIHIPDIKMPEEMEIKGWVNLMGYDRGLLLNPLPVQLRDAKGNPINLFENISRILQSRGGESSVVSQGSGGGRTNYLTIKGFMQSAFAEIMNADGQVKVAGSFVAGSPASAFVIPGNSEGVVYNSDNPLPVTITSGAGATSATNIVDSTGVAYSGSNPIPVTFSPSGSQNVNVFDGQASTVTSHQDSTGDFRGLDITNLRTINVESALNSSTTVLGNGAAFTGLAEDVKDYSVVQVSVFADQVSATDGLQIQQSSNGTNWDIVDSYTIPASTGKTFSFQIAARYFRVVYTNGATLQGAFRLYSVLHQTVSKNSSQRPGDGLSNENDFEQVSAYLSALNSSGNWDRLRSNVGTADGALRVVHASDAVTSVIVNGFLTSVAATIVDSSGVQYSGSNPVPINMGTALDQTIDSISVRQASGFIDSVAVTSFAASVAASMIDSSGVQYSGSNPIPITIISGALTSSIAVGAAASGVADDGSAPLQQGGIARTANPGAVSGGQVVKASFDKIGRQLIRPVQVRDLIATAYITLSTGTEATILAAAAASYLDLIMITATNNSTAAVQVDIRATTGGNIIHTMYLPAQSGPVGWAPPVPWPQDSTGNTWTADMADVTGTSVYISALFSKEI